MASSSLRTLLPRSTRGLASAGQKSARCAVGQAQKRQYSTPLRAPDASDPRLSAIDVSQLSITKTASPKPITPNEELVFGRAFTDHMMSLEWTATDGWLPPRITPYQNLSLDPATCVLHYAFEAFEGMKAYKDKEGNVRLFRPDKNMARMNKSVSRIALPTFDGEAVIDLIKRFAKMEERFIPSKRGFSLYLRPNMIGTQRTLGVGPPGSAMLYVIASPVGPYYPTGFKAVSLEATDYAVRAWPGGVGASKLGANYAPCIVPQMQAASRGFHQNLWLFKELDPATGIEEDYVTEVGTMNLFAAIVNTEGQKELMTAPLDGTILEGVVRDSVLALARERLAPQGWKVSERRFAMRELVDAANEGRMIEVFGSGTAATVSPVRAISYKGKLVDCGIPEGEEVGPVCLQMKDWIEGIQYGEEEHPWSVKC
ncbi:Branched-chain-amino-acid aminotransferase, cytosolic [Fulvia fulva]|uniref:Branched-chain-amino-acid aminotransferase n=1 Tax=Passalora fulva TaxID=5499 RepID=A0A9Q8LA92_PASFU|nr:Branched-chain-amino-acid aminotransferase, cytosolic [Fulvia fulva]KAK4636211.1 Branched-chain-amino-acid aminotransferase, cytosolic [Fulvia fulva]KAK4638305.1 Branched-chain-amino-acid aminotransferase, cytosolic [Fulvia fulva]UJO13043.1 Branched-chain-amino-acid aminotransferase, cytosolic [Fulvia fulva]WPV08705.1 Branched-chain-amino-acid aminotransferase, cytosolic [Fulvia fulva]WPV23172.1 Branched-chain-amino-acid aminotransferase, cytosolic [Fulvia fulva]